MQNISKDYLYFKEFYYQKVHFNLWMNGHVLIKGVPAKTSFAYFLFSQFLSLKT